VRNTSGGVTFDLRRLRREDHERFVNTVLNGKRQMPPWRGVLGLEQIEKVWAYIRETVDRWSSNIVLDSAHSMPRAGPKMSNLPAPCWEVLNAP
jgi:hypothetical protein